ncbi:MAG: peptide ABC transporter substrate-binding protein [Candidatus Eremiobacteraeota bacterium]|nr:peptide ABC transporter substrate-binding protein [Candidatus Eremiobacteraeota bacterium]
MSAHALARIDQLAVRLAILLGILMVLGALAACSSPRGKINASAPSGSAKRAGANPWTMHGVLRFSEQEEPNTLIKMFSNQEFADDVTALLFEPFFRFDDRGQPVPALATTFPTAGNGLVSKDGLRVTFKLRPNARWSDGAPVTADDVVFTWHAIMNPANPVTHTAGYDKIKTILVQGPHQVTVVLREPFAPAVYLFSEGDFPPLPAHLLAGHTPLNNIPYDSAPVGDGPFVLARWDRGSELIFDANPRYWRGRPRLDHVRIRIIPSTTTALQLLRTHEIDVLDGVPKAQVRELDGIDGIRIHAHLIAAYRHLDFNVRNPILADVAVRRAIARGIDYRRIMDTVYAGYGERAASDIPPFSWAANDLKPIPYDPATARRILDDAGWLAGADGVRAKHGTRLALTLSSAAGNRAAESAEALIQQQLKAVGIDLAIKNYAGAVLFDEHGPLFSGTYDMAWIENTEGVDPDDLAAWGCDYMPRQGINTDFFCDRRVDAYLRDAQRRSDQAVRRRDYEQAWTIMLDEVPAVIVYWDKSVVAANSDLRNYVMSPVITDFWNCWEWEI